LEGRRTNKDTHNSNFWSPVEEATMCTTRVHGFDELCGDFDLDILDSFEDPELSQRKYFHLGFARSSYMQYNSKP
jgi:hypothetical protein